jgi:hypothetical protein
LIYVKPVLRQSITDVGAVPHELATAPVRSRRRRRLLRVCIEQAFVRREEISMEQILINLISGALGGVAAGKSSPTFDLGMIGNIIAGVVGGGVLGQIVTLCFRRSLLRCSREI